jgi:HSP20 family molecular chaperone IbpA
LQSGKVIIKGSRHIKQDIEIENVQRVERGFGNFVRQFAVPESVMISGLSAKLTNGVMRVSLEKGKQVLAQPSTPISPKRLDP